MSESKMNKQLTKSVAADKEMNKQKEVLLKRHGKYNTLAICYLLLALLFARLNTVVSPNSGGKDCFCIIIPVRNYSIRSLTVAPLYRAAIQMILY